MAWRKIRADLRLQRRRVIAVVLAVAVGIAALSTALGARAVLRREIARSFDSALPPSIKIHVASVDERMLASVREVPGVIDADARRLVRARVEVSPGEWLPLQLYGVRDFGEMRVSRVFRVSGSFPPPTNELVLEQSTVGVLRTKPGATLRLRVPGRETAFRIAGLVQDPAQAPGWQDHEGYAYVSAQTLDALGLGETLDEVRIRAATDRTIASTIAEEVARRLRDRGHDVRRIEVTSPKHPHADHMNVMLTVLTVFGALALILAGTLTATVIAFIMNRAAGEIATMKTIGASTRAVTWLYVRFVLLLAVPAVLVGMGLGSILGGMFQAFTARQLNLVVADGSVPSPILIAEFLVGLAVPLLASAPHVARAARISVRAALLSHVVQPGRTGARRSRVRNVAGSLAWRGLFRRRARLIVTLGALSIGGAALMTAMNVYDALVEAVDGGLAKRGDDIEVRLARPVPAEQLPQVVASIPGVRRVEVWGAALAALELERKEGAPGTNRYAVLAPPAGTRHFGGVIVAGRMLDLLALNEVVVGRALLDKERALQLGNTITLVVDDRRHEVEVVGVVEELGPPTFYASEGVMSALVGEGQAGSLRIVVDNHDAMVASEIEERLIERGWFPTMVMTRTTLRKAMLDHFLIVLMLLSSAALAAVLVGSLSLATSTSLNVLERSREIAIMRALGASVGRVRRLLLLENAMLVGASVIVAGLLAMPLTAALQHVIGKHGLFVSLPYVFSPLALGGWALVSALILVLACAIPTRRARFAPVQDVLAHE
jgi:putative ABC transport system permease protein